MADNALALIQAKIVETEEKLAKLRVTENELSKVLSVGVGRAIPRTPAKRGRPAKTPEAESEPRTSLTSRIRSFLRANSPASALEIAEGLGVDTRPISFALQALKRKGEVKGKDGEWTIKGRKKAA